MSDNHLFPPSEAAKARTFVTAEQYEQMYARSVSDPEGFWAEQARRIDWIKAPTKIKNTSYAYPAGMSVATLAPLCCARWRSSPSRSPPPRTLRTAA